MRALLLSAIVGLCCGCFVLDEFDRGEEIMRQVSPGGAKRAEKAAAAASPAETSSGESAFAGIVDTAKEWWGKATSTAQSRSDPNDHVVRCRVNGEVQYMRASDCQIRGGDAA